MNTNEELFNQLRAKFSDLTMGDADAQSTTDPKMAQFFSFEFYKNFMILFSVFSEILPIR